MTTRLTLDLPYDAPLDRVAAMLADPAFREKVCEAQRVKSRSVTVTGDTASPSGLDVVIDRSQEARGVPSFAKKLIGDEIRFVQREHWSSDSEGSIEMTIPGKPGQLTGRSTLTASAAGGTAHHVELEISVSIPLVGGKVEQLVRDLMTKALNKEHEVGQAWLQG